MADTPVTFTGSLLASLRAWSVHWMIFVNAVAASALAWFGSLAPAAQAQMVQTLLAHLGLAISTPVLLLVIGWVLHALPQAPPATVAPATPVPPTA